MNKLATLQKASHVLFLTLLFISCGSSEMHFDLDNNFTYKVNIISSMPIDKAKNELKLLISSIEREKEFYIPLVDIRNCGYANDSLECCKNIKLTMPIVFLDSKMKEINGVNKEVFVNSEESFYESKPENDTSSVFYKCVSLMTKNYGVNFTKVCLPPKKLGNNQFIIDVSTNASNDTTTHLFKSVSDLRNYLLLKSKIEKNEFELFFVNGLNFSQNKENENEEQTVELPINKNEKKEKKDELDSNFCKSISNLNVDNKKRIVTWDKCTAAQKIIVRIASERNNYVNSYEIPGDAVLLKINFDGVTDINKIILREKFIISVTAFGKNQKKTTASTTVKFYCQ